MSDRTETDEVTGAPILDPSELPNHKSVVMHGGEFDGARVEVVDGRKVDMMLVFQSGVVTAQARIPKAQAIAVLQHIIDLWEVEAETEASDVNADRAERRGL